MQKQEITWIKYITVKLIKKNPKPLGRRMGLRYLYFIGEMYREVCFLSHNLFQNNNQVA